MRNKIILFLLILTLGVSLKLLFPAQKELAIDEFNEEINKELSSFPGKEVFSSVPQWLTKENKPFYLAGEFQKLVSQSKVVLDKDVYLQLGIIIENPIIISSEDNTRKKIHIYNPSVAFSIFENDVKFENIDFYLTNVSFFVQGRDEKINARPKNMTFSNCNFFIHGKTSLTFDMDNLVIENSFFNNKRKNMFLESSFVWFMGNNLSLINNSFIDLIGGIHYPIFIDKSKNVNIHNNVIISYQKELKALITVSDSSNISIKDNYIEDINFKPKSLALSQAPLDDEDANDQSLDFLEGGIGIWVNEENKIEIKNNLWGVNNEIFNQKLNNKILATDSWHSEISNDFTINCKNNDRIKEILINNKQIKCRNR